MTFYEIKENFMMGNPGIHRIERKSYTFYSNSPQILHLLAIFSGDPLTRVSVDFW